MLSCFLYFVCSCDQDALNTAVIKDLRYNQDVKHTVLGVEMTMKQSKWQKHTRFIINLGIFRKVMALSKPYHVKLMIRMNFHPIIFSRLFCGNAIVCKYVCVVALADIFTLLGNYLFT